MVYFRPKDRRCEIDTRAHSGDTVTRSRRWCSGGREGTGSPKAGHLPRTDGEEMRAGSGVLSAVLGDGMAGRKKNGKIWRISSTGRGGASPCYRLVGPLKVAVVLMRQLRSRWHGECSDFAA